MEFKKIKDLQSHNREFLNKFIEDPSEPQIFRYLKKYFFNDLRSHKLRLGSNKHDFFK